MSTLFILIMIGGGAQVELAEYRTSDACLAAAKADGRPTICRARVTEEEYVKPPTVKVTALARNEYSRAQAQAELNSEDSE